MKSFQAVNQTGGSYLNSLNLKSQNKHTFNTKKIPAVRSSQ